MIQKKSTFTVEEALTRLERYCSYQDRCHQEVERKLEEMNMIQEAREVIMLHLMEHGFLNEERFARSYARGKFRVHGWGKERIRRELRQRGVSDQNIRIGLTEIHNENYMDTIRDLAMTKMRSTKGEHPLKRRKKVADFLLRKGFESPLVYDLVSELENQGK